MPAPISLLSFWRAASQSARASVRANWAPFLLLQAFGAVVVASYYGSESTRAVWNEVAAAKASGGIVFAAFSTAFFAGLLPLGLSRLSRGLEQVETRHLPWLLTYWAWHGCVVDVFYRAQALALGDNMRLSTIVAKVLIDQFVFTPLLATPMLVLAYAWKDSGYSLPQMRRDLGPRWYASRVIPLLGTSWMVWIPSVSLIYALPLALQLPVANLVQCLWSLLVLFLTQKKQEALAST